MDKLTGGKTRNFTLKVFLNDGTQVSVDCDDFVVTDNSHYYAVRDGVRIMTFTCCSVKYTVPV